MIFREGEQTDMTKQTVTFCNFAIAPNNDQTNISKQ